MEVNEVIVILSLSATLGVVFVATAAIVATYKSLPSWAQSLVSNTAEFVVGEVEEVTNETKNPIDDALLDALIARLKELGVITLTQDIDSEIFSGEVDRSWLDDPKSGEDETKPDAA